jgi:hypothetical protein
MDHTFDTPINARRARRFATAPVLALAVTAVAAAGVLVGPVTTASASSWHDAKGTQQQIRFPQGKKCLTERRIFFAQGSYEWRTFIAHSRHVTNITQKPKKIWLRRGWYRWNDCFRFVGPGPKHSHMDQWSALREERTGRRLRLDNHPVHGNYGNGAYRWGSTLTHLVRRR